MTGTAAGQGLPAAPGQAPDWSWWTVILLKPDCVARGLTGPVLAMAGEHVLVTAARIVSPAAEQILEHYADILPLSGELGIDVAAELRHIYIGHQVGLALGYGPDAAASLRSVLGDRDPAIAGPDTIRGRFGTDSSARARAEKRLIHNLIHTSDDTGAVPGDFARWYGPGSITLLRPPPAPDPGAAP